MEIKMTMTHLRRAAVPLLLGALFFLSGCGLQPVDAASEFDRRMRNAVSAYRRGDSGEAGRELNAAANLLGGSNYAYELIAMRLVERGRPADAAAFLGEKLKDREAAWDPVLWLTLADAAEQAGDVARAASARTQAAARAEEITQRIGSSRAVSRAPWSSEGEPFLRVAFYYLHGGINDSRAAIRALREALRREPDNPMMMNALGYTLADEGKSEEEYKEALELTRRAVALAPDNSAFVDSLGWALFKNNDLQGARRYLRQAVDLMPEGYEQRYHLGVVYAELGETEEAQLEFERAKRLKPGYKEAEEAIKHLKVKPGEGIVQGA